MDIYTGADRRPEMRPEVVAAEQRILTFADGLLTWMRKIEWGLEDGEASPLMNSIDNFFTHRPGNVNPGWGPSSELPIKPTQIWIMDKMDHDANRLLLELLRATWERRNWRARYGEPNEVQRL